MPMDRDIVGRQAFTGDNRVISDRSRVLVLYTGGTIGMVPSVADDPASPLHPVSGERLVPYIPNPLDGIVWEIAGLVDDTGAPIGPLDSASVGPSHWIWMAQAVARHYVDYDGFVLLHGTDTMAFTASALSFLLRGLTKPVVLTGAQQPIFQAGTDAIGNFTHALRIAGYRATGLPCVPEVTICFADVLLRGNRTTKIGTSRIRGFASPNFPHLGVIGDTITLNSPALLPAPAPKPESGVPHFDIRLEPGVMPLMLYPGICPAHLRALVRLEGIRGYVLRAFGVGTAPEDPELLAVLAEAVQAGRSITVVTPCLEGRVEMHRYAAGSGLRAIGLLSGMDMTTEAALTKLMWVLATTTDPDETARRMQTQQCGELTET